MKRQKLRKRRALFCVLCILMGSCTYKYSIWEGSIFAPGQIPLRATIESFEDNSLKERVESDTALREEFQRPLKDMIVEVIFMDLYRNGVFTSISLKKENILPLTKDLGSIYLSGSINEFSHRLTKMWLIPISAIGLALFGMPWGKVTSTVDLTIYITCIPTQKRIKEYPVQAQIARWMGLYYGGRKVLEPLQLSETLTRAIDQFKKALIQDRDLILKECPSS